MILLCCFKVVPDLDRVPAKVWKRVAGTHVETDCLPPVISFQDESALELMLRCADRAPEGLRPDLEALTLGDRRCDPYLKNLYALGFSQAMRIDENAGAVGPERTAAELAAVCAGRKPDLIVTGCQSADGSHGAVPLLLAETLGCSCVTQVLDFTILSDGGVEVRHQTDQGIATRRITPPCLLAVGNAACTGLRFPTLRAKLSLGKRPATLLSPAGAESPEGLSLLNLRGPDRKRAGAVMEGETAEERVRRFLARYGKEWGLL